MSGPEDGSRTDSRIENRGNWLCLVSQPAFYPSKLGCVERRHVDDGDSDVTPVMNQFAAQRICEADNRVFGRTVSRLQRNAAVSQRRADLYDLAAVALQHTFERGESAIHHA